jgi:hypothetical protein
VIKVTQTWTRPDVNTPFFKLSDNMKVYIAKKYTDTNKVIIQRSDDASGSLTVTLVTIFANEAAKTEFASDPEIIKLKQARRDYDTTNRITTVDPTPEEI